MTPGDIAALRQVTAARRAASESRLAALRQREDEIISRLAALDSAFRQRASAARADDLALRAGADLRWESWVEDRRRTLMTAQARLRAAMEQERATLRHEFGRDLALTELARTTHEATRRRHARRAERGE